MKKSIAAAISAAFVFLGAIAHAQKDQNLELGKQTFTACSLCHGADGKGAKAGDIVMAPNLYESAFTKSASPEPLIAAILKGIQKEDKKYLQQMVALEAALNDEQIAAVAAYVRSEFGGPKEKIKPNDVKNWRGKYKYQSTPWKRVELEQIAAQIEAGPLFFDVKYSVYEGKWEKLPDFSTMEPVQRGEIKDGILTLNVAKNLKDNFGIVFEGNLKIKYTDEYEFSLHSDDGSALIIDGENVVLHDGIHPGSVKTGKEKLEAGEHTFKVLYFEAGGGEELGLMVKTKTLGEISLSKLSIKNSRSGNSYPPIILKPENGEAIVHRAFLPNAKPRAIGVGYPDGINLVWDADVLNLAYMWRGEFMDTSRHWNGRGSGSTPLGEQQVKSAHGLPFQVLESLEEPWVPFSEAKIKYERDKADSQKEMTFNINHPDYQFRGYRLDKKRFPTFRYQYQKMEITDTFAPGSVKGSDALIRTLITKGSAGENTYLLISNLSPGVKSKDSEWIPIGPMKILIEGVDPTFRKSEGKNEVLALISGDSEIKITYLWNSPRI